MADRKFKFGENVDYEMIVNGQVKKCPATVISTDPLELEVIVGYYDFGPYVKKCRVKPSGYRLNFIFKRATSPI